MKRIDRNKGRDAGKRLLQEAVPQITANMKKPKISFQFLCEDNAFMRQTAEKSEIMDTLLRISKFTWQELIQQGKSGSGYEQFSRKQLKCPVPDADLFKNIEKVTVFHRKRKIPLIGFRIEDIFYLFRIDRRFDAYIHE